MPKTPDSRSKVSSTLSTPEISDDNDSSQHSTTMSNSNNNNSGTGEKRQFPDLDLVVEAVDYWQTRKAKPDARKINTYIAKFWPVPCQEDPNLVDRLIEESLSQGMIVLVENNEQQSYRTPSKIGRMIRMTKILPYKGEIPLVVVHKVMRAIGAMEYADQSEEAMNDPNQGAGVEPNELIMYLHRNLVLLNYSLEMLEKRILPTSIKLGYAMLLSKSGRYTLTHSYREKHGIVFKRKTKEDEEQEEEEDIEENQNQIEDNVDQMDDSNGDNSKDLIEETTSTMSSASTSANRKRKNVDDKVSTTTTTTIKDDNNSNLEISETKLNSNEKKLLQSSNEVSVQPQRVSTRKRVKKSLGPDFLEEPEHLLFYLKETNVVSKCIVCGNNVPRSKLKRTTGFVNQDIEACDPNVLGCNSCQSKAHIHCVQLHEATGVKFQWRCGSCDNCSVCKQKKVKDYIIKCRVCKKGFHTGCAKIMKNNVTSNDKGWECSTCFGTSSRLSLTPTSNPNSLLNKSQTTTSPIRKTTTTTNNTNSGVKIVHQQSNDSKISQKRKILPSSGFKQSLGVKQNHSLLQQQSINDSTLSSPTHDQSTSSNSILNNSPNNSSKSLLMSRGGGSGGGGGQSMIKDKSLFASKTTPNKSFTMIDGNTKSILETCPEIHNLLMGNIGKGDSTNSDGGANTENIELITMDEDDDQQQQFQQKHTNQENIANNQTNRTNIRHNSNVTTSQHQIIKSVRKFDTNKPAVRYNFQFWLQNELELYLKKDLSSLNRLPNRISDWDSDHVKLFAEAVCSKKVGQILKDNEFDGVSFLVLQRSDVINSLGLELGHALKFYRIIARLQSADCHNISCY